MFHGISAQVRFGRVSVRVGDSWRCSEEIIYVDILESNWEISVCPAFDPSMPSENKLFTLFYASRPLAHVSEVEN